MKTCQFKDTCEIKTNNCWRGKMKDNIIAKEVLNNKFWIVEDEETNTNIGTISYDNERYMLSDTSGCHFYDTERALKKTFNNKLIWQKIESKKVSDDEAFDVHGYPTSSRPFNPVLNVKRKLPLFSKSEKSKSLYCAGYYIIKFNKGWVKSFCPKLITIERYETRGPFKTELEMRQSLSRANAE
jgi:hypothetical protein